MDILPAKKPVPAQESQARILLLETSSMSALVALCKGFNILSHKVLEAAKKHVSDLAPTVASLLAENQLKPNELDAIAVGIGPGSYTGLRIGVMSARTLAMVTGARLLGISTFQILAQNTLSPEHQKIEIIADAQQDKIYAQTFKTTENNETKAGELEIVSCKDWLSNRDSSYALAGPGLTKVLPMLDRQTTMILETAGIINKECFLTLAMKKLMSQDSDNPLSLQPLYLRRSSAEEQWDRKVPNNQ